MSSSTAKQVWRYSLFGVGVMLLVAAAVFLYIGRSRFEVRAVGLVALVLSAYAFRKSNLSVMPRAVNENPGTDGKSGRPSAIMWVVGVGLIALTGIAYALMYQDALDGYKNAIPAYFFAGAALTAAAFWGYLISRIR